MQHSGQIYAGGAAITYAAWVNFISPTTNSYQTIINAPQSCCAVRLLVDSNMHPYWNAGEHTDVSLTSYAFPIGQWLHVAFTITTGSGANAILYVNGSEVISSNSGIPGTLPSLADVEVAAADSLQWPAKALFNDVLIYNRALSASEVSSLYQVY